MKLFIWKFSLLILVILFFNLLVFLFSYKYYFKPYVKIPNKSFQSFIFSDSHGLPLNPFSEDFGVYNFSYGSDSYYDILRKLKYLVNSGYQIENVYVSLDSHTLSFYRENLNNLDRSSFFLPHELVSEKLIYFQKFYLKYYFPIVQPNVRKLLKAYFLEIFKPDFKNLKKWEDLEESDKIRISTSRVNGQFPSQKSSLELENALIEIIHLSKESKFNLIGVKFPLSNSYLSHLGIKDYGAKAIFLKFGIPVLDYSDVFIENDHYFKDSDHLNSDGGELFATMLFNSPK